MSARLARFFSVRVRLHPTWYIAVVLMTGILVTQYTGYEALWQRILLGLTGSLLFMFSMVIVVLITNIVSILARVRVRNTTLFVFGGVAVVPEDGTNAGREVSMATVAIVLNFIVAGLFNWSYLHEASLGDSTVVPMLQWLAFFWYMLAILHLLPAFPLAMGRILTAAIWKSSDNYLRAIRWSGRTGFVVGLAMAALGLVRLLGTGGQTTNGLLLLFVGWALEGAAVVSMRRGAFLHALQHTTARNVMTREFAVIGPDVSIADIVRDRVLLAGQDFFSIADQNRLLGVVTADNIARVPRNRWDSTAVGSIATKPKHLGTASGEQSAANVLEQMDQLRVDRIPVIEEGKAIGIVTRDGILRLARIRARLKI